METIAVLATGQMGSSFAACIRAANPSIRLLTDLSSRSSRTKRLAQEAGFSDVGSLDAVLQQADVLLSVLVPDQALSFAQEVGEKAKALSAQGRLRTRFFVDLNAVAPLTVQQAARAFEGLPLEFVDGSIIGGPASATYAPFIALSGPATAVAELNVFLHPLFLGSAKVVGVTIGGASALKMSFASLTKGLLSLCTGAAVLAESYGVTQALQSQLEESRPAIYKVLTDEVPKNTAKAFRWVGEMQQIAQAYEGAGIPFGTRTFEGIAEVQRFVAESKLGDEPIEENLKAVKEGRTLEDVVRKLKEGKRD
ncbi:hypothetical protein JCM8547_006528 [Rhodosporidiobolus lusitaniae]